MLGFTSEKRMTEQARETATALATLIQNVAELPHGSEAYLLAYADACKNIINRRRLDNDQETKRLVGIVCRRMIYSEPARLKPSDLPGLATALSRYAADEDWDAFERSIAFLSFSPLPRSSELAAMCYAGRTEPRRGTR